MVRVFAPATIGNVGPGFDVLGISFAGLGDIIEVNLTDKPSEVVSITGRDAGLVPLDPEKNCAVIAAEAMLRIKGIKSGVEISIEKHLPISGGLGASAASSVGGALATALALGVTINQDEILLAALAGEEAVAGRHLDNIAPCLLGGLTMVLSVSPPKVYRLPMTADWWISILTPESRLETRTARKVLPTELVTSAWVEVMARSIGLVTAFSLKDAELARLSLIDSFAEPRRSPLIPNFEKIKFAALSAGAIGCSISGAGPTIFALAANKNAAEACCAAMLLANNSSAALCTIGQCTQQGAYKI
jgi:homoserine kinase